jgi:hypothetical protein
VDDDTGSGISRDLGLLQTAWNAVGTHLQQTRLKEAMDGVIEARPADTLEEVSLPYLSQILGGTRGNVATAKIKAIALGLEVLIDAQDRSMPHEAAAVARGALSELLGRLRLTVPRWTPSEGPLAPDALNAIERDADRAIETLLRETRAGVSIGIHGGPKTGKSTTLQRARHRAEMLDMRAPSADLGVVFQQARGEEARFWRILGRQLGLDQNATSDMEFEDAMGEWLAADHRPVLIALDSVNVLLEDEAPEWADRAAGSFMRHWVQIQRTAPLGSPWKRFGVAAALTFDHHLVPTPSLNSLRYSADVTVEVGSLSEVEVEDLVGRHLLHRGARSGPDPSALRRDLYGWLAGQPLLTQDALAGWARAEDPGDLATWVREPTVARRRLVGHLAQQIRTADSVHRTPVGPCTPEGSTVMVPCDLDRLRLLGVVDREGRWTAPYLERELAAELGAVLAKSA